MPLARWKDLCLDAADPARLVAFWSTVLGLKGELDAGGEGVLRGERPEEAIWVDRVPEPKTAKLRVHLDVRARSLQPLLAAGARVVRSRGDDGIGWTVMADPEGGEFCAFVADDVPSEPPARIFELVVDTASEASARTMSGWWADVFGGRAVDEGRGFCWVEEVAGAPFEQLVFQPVPEPRTAKNRVHWDVVCDDVPALVARGATILRPPDEEIRWHVLADPDGNEFCADHPDHL